jgi:putative redox protein
MLEHRVEFPNGRGAKLAGRLVLPVARKPTKWALFAHCFTCTKNIAAAVRISRALAERGFGVLRFDFTGLGESEGDFSSSGFSANVSDLVAAADWMRQHHGQIELLVGHSLGGAAVLDAAPRIDSSRAVATIGAPARADHVVRLLEGSRAQIEQAGHGQVHIGGRPFRIAREFLEDLQRHALPESVRSLRRALLVLHSPVDAVVGIDNASEIFGHALHPKSFVSLDRADHLLSRSADAAYVADVVAAWASRYLPDEEAEAARDAEGVTRARLGPGSFLTEMSVAGHSLVADEPPSVGGTGQGPAPYDLLAAGLAACTAMTLRLYLERKGWPFDGIEVDVRHDKIHARDCGDCETNTGRVDRFVRRLSVAGDLDDARRARLADIAGKCPVHRSFESEIRVETEMLGAGPQDPATDLTPSSPPPG